MLSDEAKIVLDFIEECRSQLMMKDEYHEVSEKMYSKLYEIEGFLKTTDEGKKLFTEFEDLVYQTINKAKETYQNLRTLYIKQSTRLKKLTLNMEKTTQAYLKIIL